MNSLIIILRTSFVLPVALLMLDPVAAEDRQLDPDVEKILRERLVVLREAATLRHEAYRTGTISLMSTLVTDQAVLDAELELAKTGSDRVRIREEMLKHAETLEKATEQLVSTAELPRTDLLTARASRLRAAADLLLERKAAAR